MKIISLFEKLFTMRTLVVFNLAIILLVELVGGGVYFAETGLVHAIAAIFVGLIMIRIFSDHASNDYIFRGFLKIQLLFFLFLGMVHIYEYLGLYVFMLNDEVVELSAMASYLLWMLGLFFALEFVYRIYQKKSALMSIVLVVLISVGFLGLVLVNISSTFVQILPAWLPVAILVGTVITAIFMIMSILEIRGTMPIFKEYSYYVIPAIILLVFAAFFEYFESTHILNSIGISDSQNLYLAHFFIYAVLSLLFVGLGKLKKPRGIYTDM